LTKRLKAVTKRLKTLKKRLAPVARLTFVFAVVAALAAGYAAEPPRGQRPSRGSAGAGDAAFNGQVGRYVREFLRRNPTVNTYLGGAGLDPSLREVDGTLRDHSARALEAEDRWLVRTQRAFESIDAGSLSPARRIDREVALAQIRFLLRQHQTRRHQQRALDTYTDEPFRAVDWQLQGMAQTGPETYGTTEEWALVLRRVQSIPRYLRTAREQLSDGVKSGNTPDQRVLRRHGLESTVESAKYFAQTLPDLARARVGAGQQRDELLQQLGDAGKAAAAAYEDLGRFVRETFFDQSGGVKPRFAADRYAMGESEYDWAIKNNLRLDTTAARLYEEAWPVVEQTRQEMFTLAREIAGRRKLTLPPDAAGGATVRLVFDELGKEFPKSDAEMVEWYREAARRLVEYGRKSGMFDVPADYKLEIVETPPPLRASVDGAVYYPAPPFKRSGVGRFYVTPTGGDAAALKEHNRSALADLAAHEGFPGHDWHYKVMTEHREEIAPVRWLTPGSVEDSSSMWQDSMAMEGWGLYSEALLAEPQPGFPAGFYTPEERLYQLRGKLYRDLRVRIDTGLHTGRMSYDEAVDLFSQVVDFLPGSCRGAESARNPDKRASCHSSERAIFRYSKWPTQAITYRLGKDQIFALRREAQEQLGTRFSPKEFHLLFMRQGSIPAGYFRDEVLRALRPGR
jgi:uncharacterized protein (DUF885 family)